VKTRQRFGSIIDVFQERNETRIDTAATSHRGDATKGAMKTRIAVTTKMPLAVPARTWEGPLHRLHVAGPPRSDQRAAQAVTPGWLRRGQVFMAWRLRSGARVPAHLDGAPAPKAGNRPGAAQALAHRNRSRLPFAGAL